MNEIQHAVAELTTKAAGFSKGIQEAATILTTETSWIEIIATGIVIGLSG